MKVEKVIQKKMTTPTAAAQWESMKEFVMPIIRGGVDIIGTFETPYPMLMYLKAEAASMSPCIDSATLSEYKIDPKYSYQYYVYKNSQSLCVYSFVDKTTTSYPMAEFMEKYLKTENGVKLSSKTHDNFYTVTTDGLTIRRVAKSA